MQIIDCLSLYQGLQPQRFKDWTFLSIKTHSTFKIASPNVKIKATIQYNLVTANILIMNSHLQRSQFYSTSLKTHCLKATGYNDLSI